MTATVVAVFAVVYFGMILGGLPFLQLDRTGVALLGALCRPAAAAGAPIDVSALSQFTCPDDQGLVDRKIIRYCGHVAIPGGKLAVVVLIPPEPEKAERTPTVFVHGGPGFGVVDGWATIGALRLAADAPLVIFDQRSTGLSEPKRLAEPAASSRPTNFKS